MTLQKYIYQLLAVCTVLFLIASCDSQITTDKEEELITVTDVPLNYNSNSSTNSITSAKSKQNNAPYYCIVSTLNSGDKDWAYNYHRFDVKVPPGLVKQAKKEGVSDKWVTFRVTDEKAASRIKADTLNGGGIVRMGRCKLPATQKVLKIVKKRLKKFKAGSWVEQIKQQNDTNSNPQKLGPDPIKPAWVYICTAVIDYWICDDPNPANPYTDPGCTYIRSECVEYTMIYISEDDPDTGGGSSDDADPCTVCTSDPFGPQTFCISEPSGGESVPEGCAAPAIDNEFLDPCEQAAELANNSMFRTRMSQTMSYAMNYNKGAGYTMVRNTSGDYSYSYFEGQEGVLGVDLSVPNPIDGYMHSHHGGLSIFSVPDLRTIYDLYNGGYIKNVAEFTMGLATVYGTTYLLKISNLDNFLAFGEMFLKNDIKEALLIQVRDKDFNIDGDQSVSQNEKGFLQLIKDYSAGLKIFKGDPNNFNSWQAKTVNSAGTVVDGNCN